MIIIMPMHAVGDPLYIDIGVVYNGGMDGRVNSVLRERRHGKDGE